MAGDLERRTPRSVREAKAYRAVQVGTVAGGAFVVTLVLSIVGVIGAALPVILLIVTLLAVARFAMVTELFKGR